MSAAVLDREAVEAVVVTRKIEVLDRPDLSRSYDVMDEAAVAEARAQFADLVARGYFAYREGGGSGEEGNIRHFSTEADITYVPVMVGG